MQAPNVYAAIPGMAELGMVWMGDVMVPTDPSHELLLDPRHTENFFSAGAHPFGADIRSHQIAPTTTMVRYMAPTFINDCSEPEEPGETMDSQDLQNDYDPQSEGQEMNEFYSLDDYAADEEREEREQVTNNAATQTTQDNRTRKIKPIKHPGLVLKTPIAYQPHTDLSFIPIRKDGMAVCQKCGAIGVKHAFYTKERRFCSRACARSSEHGTSSVDSTNSPSHSNSDQISSNSSTASESKQRIDDQPTAETERRQKPRVEKVERKEAAAKPITPEQVLPEDLPLRRKRTPDMEGSYDWTSSLEKPGFCAAPVSCFKHAPISEIWSNISIGMKVECENTDCDAVCEEVPDSFWVATVKKIYGYRALMRYEGFEDDHSKDFWVSLCSDEIHPVGWCASRGKPLIPPNTISKKYKDWKGFLKNRLTGARTLPTDFHLKVNNSMKSRFREGLLLEVVDKNRISQVKVASICKIVGKRLLVRYYDSETDEGADMFWCHEDSPLIHPVGWAKRVGQDLQAPEDYVRRVAAGKHLECDAKEELFCVPKNHLANKCNFNFSEGMKIEAIDPLNLSSICAATVKRVLKDNYIMVSIDNYEDDSGKDWFCYHSSSPCIFPVGFCSQNDVRLTPPKGYDLESFTWDSFLKETGTKAAPLQLFNSDIPNHGFVEGMRLEAADIMDPRLVCVATITLVIGRLLRVHFDGWEDEYDQWMDCQSPDIYPVGWCVLVEHKLESPREIPKNFSPSVKPQRGLKRKLKKKIKKSNKILCQRSSSFAPRHSERISTVREREREVGPAEGTKIERERDLESLPEKRSREPEPAEEPAGPDQTLPSPTSGQGQSLSEPPHNEVQSQPPKERTATSYINGTSASAKNIPRLQTGGAKIGEVVPSEWNVFDVAQFLRINDCITHCENFSERKIDGNKLMSLTSEELIDITGKVGPALKIYDLITQLKNAQERHKLGQKKLHL